MKLLLFTDKMTGYEESPKILWGKDGRAPPRTNKSC